MHFKIWYLTIIERVVLFGVHIWGFGEGNLAQQAVMKLISIQIIFLLQISRGYITISTDAFHALTVNSPNKLQLRYEHDKSPIFKLKNNTLVHALFPNKDIQHNVKRWQLHPAEESSYLHLSINCNSYTICLNFHALHLWLWHQD